MIFFLGCDVSSTKLDVALVDGNGVTQWHDQLVNNTADIYAYLLTVQGHYPEADCRVVVESTGRYHYQLVDAAEAVGLTVLLYNPLLTKQHVRSSVRGKKTDKTDAVHIARIGMQGDIRSFMPEPYRNAKHYIRAQVKLTELGVGLRLHNQHLEAVLDDALSAKARELVAAIQTQLSAAKRQFVTETLALLPQDLVARLRSVPGIGPYVAASLIAEIQDIHRFTNSNALIAYAGLDPKVKQSGTTLNNTGRLTKRGSAHLRRSLFIAANIARQHDPYFKALYDKKRAEGKKHTVATIVVARKLLTITRAVWLHEQDYSVAYWEMGEKG